MSDKDRQHFSGAVTSQLLRHVEAEAGPGAVMEVLARAGETRSIPELRSHAGWSSYDQVRALFEEAATLLGGPASLERMHQTVPMIISGRPSTLQQIQAFGSPEAMYGSAAARLPVSTIISLQPRELGPSDWLIGHRLDPGFEPYPELCAYLTAVNGMTPAIFGMRVTRLCEQRCVCRGDDECAVRVSWEGDDAVGKVAFLEARLALAERRVEELRDIVAEVVSDDDLETVLERLVETADKAIWARGFVLALSDLPGTARRVYAHGVGQQEAERIAAAILEGDLSESLVGRSVVVDVASAKNHYGRLAVLGLRRLTGQGRQLVASYSGLVAARLDSAVALEEARRQAATSRILLELSASLSHIVPPDEIAERVVQALPGLVDCDAAGVMLVSEGQATMSATWGLSPKEEVLVTGRPLPVRRSILEAEHTISLASGFDPATRRLLEAAGVKALALSPVRIDGTLVGLIGVSVKDRPERLKDEPDLRARLDGLAGQFSSALRTAGLVEQIRYQALHDPLTGVANRTLLVEEARKALALARRRGTPVAAFFIDLDRFKEVNDTLGHPAGDLLLQAVATRLREAVRTEDSVGRLGGDEFVVVAQGRSLEEGAEILADRLLDVLAQPVVLPESGKKVPVGASIGVAVGDRRCAEDLIRDADLALYHAKVYGRGRYTVFSADMSRASATP